MAGGLQQLVFALDFTFALERTYSCASLDKELADGRTVVHGVERGNLVDTHGRHLQQAGDLVHDANASVAVLALAQIKQGHDGGLFVLRRVTLENLGNDGLVVLVEFERDVGVVFGRVAVLRMLALLLTSCGFCSYVSIHPESIGVSVGCWWCIVPSVARPEQGNASITSAN